MSPLPNPSIVDPPPTTARISPISVVRTKKDLIQALVQIKGLDWIENDFGENGDGAAGDILEALLGVPKNNLPIADAWGWELKTHRQSSSSMVSLSHKEMKTDIRKSVVSKMMLPIFGWPHQEAGSKYPSNELSLRTDIVGNRWNARGFKLRVDRDAQRVYVSYEPSMVADVFADWRDGVAERLKTIAFSEPYYDFSDFYMTIGRKFLNCFFVKYEEMRQNGAQYIRYTEAYVLENVDVESFMKGIESGDVKIEFDARTGHNHGTKMRMFEDDIPDVYSKVTRVM